MTSAPDPRLPLYEQVKDFIAQGVAQQRWKPGEAIPTEAELARQFQVAIGTVRKAVDALVTEGLLDRFQGRGTFVRRPEFNASLFRFFRFQSQSGERRVPESRIFGRDVLEAPAAVASALRLEPGGRVLRLSRLRLIDDAPVLSEEIWLPHALFRPLAEAEIESFGDLLYPLYEARCGQSVARAEETLTVAQADPIEARRLGIEPGAPVVVIERLAFNYEGRPIEWRRSQGAGAQFRYQVEIR